MWKLWKAPSDAVQDKQGKEKYLQASLDRLQGDQMDAFEAYKDGTTDKETFIQQKELYDQLEAKLDDRIWKQSEIVKALEEELDSMPEGLAADSERISVDKLTKDVVEAFVEKVIVKPGQQVEIRWKFQQ